MRLVLATVLVLSACNGDDQINISGYQMSTFFPFDGVRNWEFTDEDPAATHTLVATLDTESTLLDDGIRVHEIRYDRVCIDPNDDTCEDEWVRSLVWGTNRSVGTTVREIHTPTDDLIFDEPVFIASNEMRVGDSVTSGEYTSTFQSIDECPVLLTVEWDFCVHMVIEGGSGLGNEALAGDYWAVSNFNIVSFELASEAVQYKLTDTFFGNE